MKNENKQNKYGANFTTKYEYRKMSWRHLVHDFHVLAKQSNAILKDVEKKGLRNYGASYARKWNPMLFGDTIPNLGTAKGRFSTKLSNKENLIERMQAMDEFINNPNVYAGKIQKDLDELSKRIGLRDTGMLLKIFDIYRDYGFESYKDDSDRLLIAFSEVANTGGDVDRFAQLLNTVEAMDNITQEDVVSFAETFRDHYNAYNDWHKAENFAYKYMKNTGSNRTPEQRKLAARSNMYRRAEARSRRKGKT